ncbi:hypothetical protein GQX74_004935 [Glossina fuscipes]|nr:hypothetical protein GQX74_004935 [Glossina fuscipes]
MAAVSVECAVGVSSELIMLEIVICSEGVASGEVAGCDIYHPMDVSNFPKCGVCVQGFQWTRTLHQPKPSQTKSTLRHFADAALNNAVDLNKCKRSNDN